MNIMSVHLNPLQFTKCCWWWRRLWWWWKYDAWLRCRRRRWYYIE